jgi:myo-inositol-1(or 4)-monophosphatase
LEFWSWWLNTDRQKAPIIPLKDAVFDRGPFPMSDYFNTCERAARAGGQVLLDWIGKIAAREKAPADLVTEADLASQEEIRRIVLSSFPDHSFLGEEGSAIGPADAEFRWLVDPLAGTTNYVHQIPH